MSYFDKVFKFVDIVPLYENGPPVDHRLGRTFRFLRAPYPMTHLYIQYLKDADGTPMEDKGMSSSMIMSYENGIRNGGLMRIETLHTVYMIAEVEE